MVRVMQKMGLDAELIDFLVIPEQMICMSVTRAHLYKTGNGICENWYCGLFSLEKNGEQVFFLDFKNVLKKSKRAKIKMIIGESMR